MSSLDNIIWSSMDKIIMSSDKIQRFLCLVKANLIGPKDKKKIVVMLELPMSVYVAYMVSNVLSSCILRAMAT
jgi:hypothetical protein